MKIKQIVLLGVLIVFCGEIWYVLRFKNQAGVSNPTGSGVQSGAAVPGHTTEEGGGGLAGNTFLGDIGMKNGDLPESEIGQPGLHTLAMGRLQKKEAGDSDVEEEMHAFRMQVVGLDEIRDLRRLWLHLQENGPDDEIIKRQMEKIVLERWAQLGGSEAVDLLMSVATEDDIYTRDSFSAILNAWASVDPLRALEWYHSEEQDGLVVSRGYTASPQFYKTTFGELFEKDQALALASIESVERFSDAEAAVEGFTERAVDPGKWINIFEGLEYAKDLANREALLAVAYTKANLPLEAAEWVGKVSNQTLRVDLARKVAEKWVSQDAFAAADWLYGQALSRPDAIEIVEGVLLRHSPTAFSDWARKNNITL